MEIEEVAEAGKEGEVEVGFAFDRKTQSRIKALKRKERIPQIIKYLLVVLAPAVLVTFLMYQFVPALSEKQTVGSLIQSFVIVTVALTVAFVFLNIIKKQAKPFPFDKEITPDVETKGIVYEYRVLTLNRRGDKGAYVKVVVPKVKDFMYCRVPANVAYEAGETVVVAYDSTTLKTVKHPKSCKVSKVPDFSRIEKSDAENFGALDRG